MVCSRVRPCLKLSCGAASDAKKTASTEQVSTEALLQKPALRPTLIIN